MRRFAVLLIVILVAAIGASYWFLLRPTREALETAQAAETSARGRVAQLERALEQAREGTGEVDELTTQLAALEAVMPGEFNVSQLLAEMPELPARFGLQSPGGGERINAKFTDIQTYGEDNRLTYIDFTYELVGSLGQFDDLFTHLTTRRPITTIVSFSGAQASDSQHWRGTLVVRVWSANIPVGQTGPGVERPDRPGVERPGRPGETPVDTTTTTEPDQLDELLGNE